MQRILDGIVRWWRFHFSGVDRREAWGYGVWFSFAALVLVPELWAAFWGDSARWPTISGTVAGLEYDHPILGLVVVGVIVLCAYSSLRFPADRTGVLQARRASGEISGGSLPGDPALPYRTASGRRLTRSVTPVRELAVRLYFGLALVVIVGGTTIVALTTDPDDEYPTGRTLYGLTALFWVVIPSLLAWPKRFALDVPFPTLFETVRNLERRVRVLALAIAAGLTMLLLHLVLYPWPSVIPDLQRLHKNYECHPLPPAQLTEERKAACRRLEEAEVKPSPTSP
jgi:hypothetical protein